MSMTAQREADIPPDNPAPADDDAGVIHRVELAALSGDKAGQARYAWTALGGPASSPTGKECLDFLARWGGNAGKSAVYKELAVLREEHGQPDTGTLRKLSPAVIADMDAARARKAAAGGKAVPATAESVPAVPAAPVAPIPAVPADLPVPVESAERTGTQDWNGPERVEFHWNGRNGVTGIPVGTGTDSGVPVERTEVVPVESEPAGIPVEPLDSVPAVPVESVESVESAPESLPVPVEFQPEPDAAAVEAALARQANPAFMAVWSKDETKAERELAERIREQGREQRWKAAQAAAEAADAGRRMDERERERDRKTTEAIRRQDARDVLAARKALAAQRRATSPHAQLASLYRHRTASLAVLGGVVAGGMLWSAVNVQHNIAPGGMNDPLYWFSFLIEAMISSVLVTIMVGTNKVAEWGITDNKLMVAGAEAALLVLTLTLNTFPSVRAHHWFDTFTHAVAPVMIGVALLVHHAVSTRYGKAITQAAALVAETEPVTLQRWQSERVDPPQATAGAGVAALERGE